MKMSYAEAAEILRNREAVGYDEAVEVALSLLNVAADERFAELPCRLGAPIWWVDGDEFRVRCEAEDVVESFLVKHDGVFLNDGSPVGSQFFCLNREQAEAILANMEG